MAKQKQDDQLEHTYSSYVRIRDVALKTCQRRWMVGKSGERGSGISVLAAWHDDDDNRSLTFRIRFPVTISGPHKSKFSSVFTIQELLRAAERIMVHSLSHVEITVSCLITKALMSLSNTQMGEYLVTANTVKPMSYCQTKQNLVNKSWRQCQLRTSSTISPCGNNIFVDVRFF